MVPLGGNIRQEEVVFFPMASGNLPVSSINLALLPQAGRCQLLCCCVAGSSDLYIEAEAAGEDASGDI